MTHSTYSSVKKGHHARAKGCSRELEGVTTCVLDTRALIMSVSSNLSFLSRPARLPAAQPQVRGFYGNRSLPTRTPPGRPLPAVRSNRTRNSYQPNDGLFSLPPVTIPGYHEEDNLAEANG